MATGWLLIGEDYYYFNTNGKKVTGRWVGNYYLKSDGTMARAEWVDQEKYYVDENGNLELVSANPELRNTNVFVSSDSGSSVKCYGKVLMGFKLELPDYLFEE